MGYATMPVAEDSATGSPGSAKMPLPDARRIRTGRVPDLVLLLPVVILAVAVRAWNIGGLPFPNDDEGTYLAQAWAVRHAEGLAHYTYWYDHPPLGWIQLAAVSWLPSWLLPDLPAFVQGRIAMLPVAAATTALIWAVARRGGLNRRAAGGAALLHALSPLSVTLGRQIYLDNFAVLWVLAAFAFALSPRRHLWHHVGAGVCLAFAMLSKETIAVVLPAVVVALWQGSHRRTRAFSVAGFASGLLGTALLYPLYALLKNELLPGAGHVSLLGTLKFQLAGRAGTGSVFAPGTEAHALVRQWLDTDPVLPLAGLAATLVVLALPPRSGLRLRGPALAAVVLALVALRPGGYLPKMYIVQLLPFLAIALAAVVQAAIAALPAERLARGGARGARGVRATAAALLLTGAAVLTVPPWAAAGRHNATTAETDAYYRAARWLREGHIPDPGGSRVVVDGVLWLDAVGSGLRPGTGAIWHYKVDQDPAIAETMPHGWRDIDYVVSTPALRGERHNPQMPTIADLLRHATPVATFGEGDGRIDILKTHNGQG
ncbi:ArnT family glycosyltransferase [Streptomyces hygroscopicus]|uniref:ArnT family glycosyltransferase n=1 Tax=Streptomyces hygroscopicus TaxID=1912 RepID=UPI0027E2CCE0|nr:glycosyltransferase family 39 protein [Streptomyces hygroscopicus]